MTIPLSITGVFCEDIREEKSNLVTLIGVMPDNLEVSTIPGSLPKLCAYIRVHFDPQEKYGALKHTLVFPDGSSVDAGGADLDVVLQAQTEAATAGNPIASVFARIEVVGFQIPSTGRIRIETSLGGISYIACTLNFKLGPTK